jgi:hypothetical protein
MSLGQENCFQEIIAGQNAAITKEMQDWTAEVAWLSRTGNINNKESSQRLSTP